MDNAHNDYKSPTRLSSTSSLIPLQHSRNVVPSVAEAKETGESNHQDQNFLNTSSRLSNTYAFDHQHISKSSRLLQYANSLSRLNDNRDVGVDDDIPVSESPRSNRRITHSTRDLNHQENMERPGNTAGRSHLFMEYPSGRFFPQQNIVSHNIVHQSTIDNEHERREEVVKFFSLKSRSLLCFAQGILAGVGFQSFYESLKLTNIQSGTTEKDEAAISFQIYFFFTMISLVGYLTKIRLRNSSLNEDKKTADWFFISNLANSIFYSISLLLTCIILILEFLDDGVDTMIILGLILMRSCCCLLSWILSAWSQ
jgi:hypothetical protein